MTANEAGLEVFIDDTTVDRRSRTYYEAYVEMHSAQIQPGAVNLTRQRFTLQMEKNQSMPKIFWRQSVLFSYWN